MARTVQQVITEVSAQLNDQEPSFLFTRWTQTELINYLNGALIEIGNYRPDAFTSTQDITIQPGSQQSLPTGFSLLKSIDANGASSNCPGSPIIQCDMELMRSFFKQPCLPTGGATNYRVRTYAYDARNPRVFYVSPPVPVGNTSSVTATMVADAPQYNIGQLTSPVVIDQKYYPAIMYFMQMRAYEVDTESATSQRESDRYKALFYNMMGVNLKQISGYNSGNFIGQGGDNNMTKARPQ